MSEKPQTNLQIKASAGEIKNPLGTDGFEFLEFASTDAAEMKSKLEALGMVEVAKHPEKEIWLFRQNEIYFILNSDPASPAYEFAKAHGPSVSAMGFRVESAINALSHAEKCGVEVCHNPNRTLDVPSIVGIGNSIIYLIDESGRRYYHDLFQYPENSKAPEGAGLDYIDHVTHNLYRGNMDKLAKFYGEVFNFHEIRYFHITGQKTGLLSRAIASPCGKIRIPLNESTDDISQIEEFLKDYRGEGIQHIALGAKEIFHTVEIMRENGVQFLDTPDTYYKMIDQRLPKHGEDVDRLQKNKILVDGVIEEDGAKLLLQIFTANTFGPVFFEIIQRKGDEGFGEGNFQALFEAIERDQMDRGVI